MSDETKRAAEMLRVAAKYIQAHCPDRETFYDEAVCDGYCVADDCLIAANMLGDEA